MDLCSSSGPATGALPAWQVGGRADADLGCREGLGAAGRAGRAGAVTMATFGSEWIPLSGAQGRLGRLGAKGEATAPGKGRNRQRLVPGRATVGDPDTDTLCPQSQALAAPRPTGPGTEGETHWGGRSCSVPLFLCFTLQLSSHRAGVGQAPHPPLCPKSL